MKILYTLASTRGAAVASFKQVPKMKYMCQKDISDIQVWSIYTVLDPIALSKFTQATDILQLFSAE